MIQGEPWRYVDSDPAFGAGWENAGTMSDLAFRAINGGTEVRPYGAILDNGAAAPVTTLPDGYRPEADSFGIITVSIVNSMGAYRGGIVAVGDDGAVNIPATDTGDTVFINGSFPITPPTVTP